MSTESVSGLPTRVHSRPGRFPERGRTVFGVSTVFLQPNATTERAPRGGVPSGNSFCGIYRLLCSFAGGVSLRCGGVLAWAGALDCGAGSWGCGAGEGGKNVVAYLAIDLHITSSSQSANFLLRYLPRPSLHRSFLSFTISSPLERT